MSYRNPQIVVDNSGSAYGGMIANFGATVAKGIDSFTQQRAKAAEIARKREESTQLALNQSELRENQRIDKFLQTVPDKSMNDAVRNEVKRMATTGEGNTVNVNGKDYTIGSVQAQALLNSNPNLDKDTREAYLQVVSGYNKYMNDMGALASSITVNNEQIGLDKEGFISKDYDIKGEGGVGTSNLIASMSVNNNPIEGVESKKQYSRPYNSNTKKYDNILTIKSRIDKNSVIGKSWIANNLIDNADGSVSFEEELNEKGEPTGYLTTTFERNLNEVGENGLGLIVKIQPQGAENTLANAGFINPKTAQATGEGFVTSKINGARTLDNGIRVTTSETHFNAKALKNNQAYVADNKKIAAGITALPLDQQVKYMANNLGWGNLGENKWAEMTTAEKDEMIMKSLEEDDLRKMLKGDPNKNPIMSRAATSNDVALYAVDKQIINEGDTIYFTETMRKAAKLDDNSDGVNNGKNAYNEFIKDPIGRYFESTGVKLGVKEDKEGNTIYTIPPRLEGEEPVELNMSNKNNEKLFYNMLLGVTKMGTGNSAKDKLFRKQFEAALEKGTNTKKIQAKKESDDYFSGEADKATAKEKKKPGKYNNINKE
jgi:hypothetical protein